ncbi:MAG: T9SS type A sorting domain-containing protein [Bacteroidales bacterium]|nr:T9SS type A sorting domain-containing protein [Bacteroidales bacterium]
MKKRFLPFSLLLVIMILGQSVMADGGHYVPRAKEATNAEAFLSSMRVNQHTGLIDPAMMIAASKQNTRENLSESLYWISMGPDNLGGRTTSILYNNQNLHDVYIGSMGGGVFHTGNGISWHQVGKDLMVSCMAQDENGTIYVGTGEGSNAYTYNGMGDLGYENGFVGSGIFTINNYVMSENPLPGTAPTVENNVVAWSFINDIAVVGNYLVAATSDGLRYSTIGSDTWSFAACGSDYLTGNAVKVKVASDQTVIASVGGKLYVGSLNNMVCCSGESAEEVNDNNVIVKIVPAAEDGFLDVAVAPSDPNVIYASVINANGEHVKIYVSYDKGTTWNIALPAVNSSYGHNVYGGRGLFNHCLVVDPNNAYRLYVLSQDIWRLDSPADHNGYYLAVKMTPTYVCHGMNDMQFNPRQAGYGYVATDGGVFTLEPDGEYISLTNCNRGYVSTRCLNVAPSSDATRVVAGVLDHGPIYIQGLDNTNNIGTCELLLPEAVSVYSGGYSEAYTSGSSAVSAICPNTFILTTLDGGLMRTEKAGADYDETNFTTNLSFTFTGYRMPIALWESFEDENSVESVWFKCTQNQNAGDVIQCFSHNGDYPFNYTLPHAMHYDSVHPNLSDSLLVPDPISAKLFVPNNESSQYNIYVTFDALQFGKATDWYKVASIANYPTCMTMSADGDVLFIGSQEGTLYRLSNLKAVVDGNTACVDSTEYAAELTEIALGDQCITSVAVFNGDNNKVVVTLGNYGNDNFIMYSNDATAATPTFVNKQGNLPKMPVYSSIYTIYRYENEAGLSVGAEHVLIGTEHGVYRTENIAAASPEWVAETAILGDVPVLDMRQQNMSHPDQVVNTIVDGTPVAVVYPGIRNQGMVYAATYGRGLFRCEQYHVQYSGTGISETPAAVATSNVSMYPNPVRDDAKICFELNDNASVSYQVYDISGRMVKNERVGNYGQGKHEVNVSVDGLAKGAYVLRLNAGAQISTVKFMVF